MEGSSWPRPENWTGKGQPDGWMRAKVAAREVLATHHFAHLDPSAKARSRAKFDTLLFDA